MSRYLLRRPLVAVGVAGVALTLGLLAAAGPAAAAPVALTPSQTPGSGWCQFLLWLTGSDACATYGNGNGNGPGGSGPPGQQPPPVTSAPPPPGPPITAPTTPAPPTTAPATVGPATPIELPTATVPAPTVAPPTAAPTTGTRAATASASRGTTSAPSTAAPVLPTAPIVTSAPFVLHSNQEPAVAAEVKPQGPRATPQEPVPPPYKGNRSVVRKVIDSGPIGRRLVIVAGVLISVLIGIGAYRLEERTQLIRRIQEWRHIEDL